MRAKSDYEYLMHVLDEAYDRLKSVYLETSVLGPVRLYSAVDSADKEFWALFCALVDFQTPVTRVLNPMLRGLASWIEGRGLKFVDLIYDEGLARGVFANFQWTSCGGVRRGFTHRFVKIEDLMDLLKVFREIIKDYGSLRAIVERAYEDSLHLEEPMEAVLFKLRDVLRERGGRPPLVPTRTWSPLKRLNLFIRWMVRPHPDLDLWRFIDKRHLLVSLDEGLQRVLSRAFNLKVNTSWNGVLEATRFLRRINPEDPVKYDYLLSRISIMGYCAKDASRSKCYLCPLVGACKSSAFKPEPKAAALRGREGEIFERFLNHHRGEFDLVKTEYPLGSYTADAVLHKPDCETYVVEVEESLNYNAIGQVLTYRYLYFKIHGRAAKPLIICSRAKRELKEACKAELGVEVVASNFH